jgi:hypothetical protein
MGEKKNFLYATLVRTVLPETRWEELDPAGYERVFRKLNSGGELGAAAVRYMQDNRVKIGFYEQFQSGAGWTLLRNITLAPGDDPLGSYALSLICHEALHISQPFFMRLSVQGELLAWQRQREVYFEIARAPIGASGQAYPGTQAHWDELSRLSPTSRLDLKAAQVVMRRISPTYRSHCLPLLPLPEEIGYHLRSRDPIEALVVGWKLVVCRQIDRA